MSNVGNCWSELKQLIKVKRMAQTKQKTTDWLTYMTAPRLRSVNKNIFAADGQVQNPARAIGSADYLREAQEQASDSDAPQSIFEGLQTAVNLARIQSGFDPLNPDIEGNKKNFTTWTENIAAAPFLTLVDATTTEITQSSQNSDAIIDSFVDAFVGISSGDRNAIIASVSNLVKAALSWSEETQKQSNFAQNLLRTEAEGAVSFHLYYSEFEISQSSNKGTITFHSEYTLKQAEYSLSQATWDDLKDIFAEQLKTSTDDWLDSMLTPDKPGSRVRATCLEK